MAFLQEVGFDIVSDVPASWSAVAFLSLCGGLVAYLGHRLKKSHRIWAGLCFAVSAILVVVASFLILP